MGLTIRTAVPADYPELAALFRASSLSNDGDRDVLLEHPDALVLPKDGIRNGQMRVAVDGGRIVGFVTAVPVDDGLELEDLFVLPDRMREGIARRLIADVVERAPLTGATHVHVTGNPHAMAFYLEFGFIPVSIATTRFGDASRLRLHLTGPDQTDA